MASMSTHQKTSLDMNRVCRNGHVIDDDNIYIRPDNGQIVCRACRREAGRRASLKKKLRRNHQPKAHCKHGHEYTPENTGRDKRGHRYCNFCKRLKGRQRINFKGFEYGRGLCQHGHKIEDNFYYREDGTKRCATCFLNIQRRRRERKVELDLNYSLEDEKITRLVFDNRCFKCKSLENIQIDHHYPLSRGFV